MRFIFLFFLFASNFLNAQEDRIFWSSDKKLVWEDFKGVPNIDSAFAAITFSGMSYNFSAEVVNEVVKVSYKVKCYFVPSKSWCKKAFLNDLELLKHEQLHFDITELYTRKFRKELSKMVFTKNVNSDIRALYTSINEEKIAFQKQYDIETDHSSNKNVQKSWEKDIQIKLQKTIYFASK